MKEENKTVDEKKEVKDSAKQDKKAEKKAEKSLKEKLADLEKEKAALEEKIAGEKNDYLKLMAEFETFRRRNTEEKLALVNSAAADTIKGLLPVLDDCERAMALLAESSDEAAKEGTSLIYNKLLAY